jgi:hypothetical protein
MAVPFLHGFVSCEISFRRRKKKKRKKKRWLPGSAKARRNGNNDKKQYNGRPEDGMEDSNSPRVGNVIFGEENLRFFLWVIVAIQRLVDVILKAAFTHSFIPFLHNTEYNPFSFIDFLVCFIENLFF